MTTSVWFRRSIWMRRPRARRRRRAGVRGLSNGSSRSRALVGAEASAQAVLAQELERLGFAVGRAPPSRRTSSSTTGRASRCLPYEGRDDVVGVLGPEEGTRRCWSGGHIDVVPAEEDRPVVSPSRSSRPARRDGQDARTPGSGDMKGGFAMLSLATGALRRAAPRRDRRPAPVPERDRGGVHGQRRALAGLPRRAARGRGRADRARPASSSSWRAWALPLARVSRSPARRLHAEIASSVARTRWARGRSPRQTDNRASRKGDPSAGRQVRRRRGTKQTPPVSATVARQFFTVSGAAGEFLTRPAATGLRRRRVKNAPSSAYTTRPSSPQAMVVSRSRDAIAPKLARVEQHKTSGAISCILAFPAPYSRV